MFELQSKQLLEYKFYYDSILVDTKTLLYKI